MGTVLTLQHGSTIKWQVQALAGATGENVFRHTTAQAEAR